MRALHSLRVRLLLVLVFVALMPVGTAAFLIHRVTEQQFRSYSNDRSESDVQTLAAQVGTFTGFDTVVTNSREIVVGGTVGYAPPGNAAGAGGVSTGGGSAAGTSNAGLISSYRSGDPLAATASLSLATENSVTVGESGGDPAPGFVITLPASHDSSFLRKTTHALLLAVGLAAVGSILLAALLARQILKPVQTLTIAAQGMAEGDLQRRAAVDSQDEIGVLARAFNGMADRRAQLEELRRNLVNDVAHELRTPLANLQGYLEVLRDAVAPPTPEVIAVLHEESLLLKRLVDDLQELALVEAGELPLYPAAVSVDEPVAQALEALRPQAEAKQVALVAETAANLPDVFVDDARLSQVLRNLLRNALAHTPAGGTVQVTAVREREQIAISVRDSGCGIAAEHLPFVFDRFYRADPARARSTGGTGLGLAIVKHLIEAHGGRIEVASPAGSGAVFTFSLPLAVPRVAV